MNSASMVSALSPPVINPAPDDEAGDVVRARHRDADAFARLYHMHLPRVHALCLRLTASASQAEEMTQRAFIAAWQHLPGFRGDSAFGSWLHRLTVNTVLGAFRAEGRRRARVVSMAEPEELPVPARTAPAGLRIDLEQAIAGLPSQARAVFVLHDVEGWRHDEIAAQLELSPGTTKAHLHRARRLLQEALQ
jgi:RNA polymerase sigma-70 factor (ECF subfamily)